MKPIKKANITKQVISTIKKYILDNNLKQGDKLPSENETCKMLDVSRNSVREAMKSLEAIGVIKKKQGSGIFVGSFDTNSFTEGIMFGLDNSRKNLGELLVVRKSFETALMELIIGKISEKDIDELQLIINKMEKNRQEEEEALLDLEFHLKLLEILDNKIISRFAIVLRECFVEYSKQTPKKEYNDYFEKHKIILDSLKENNLEKAKLSVEIHFNE